MRRPASITLIIRWQISPRSRRRNFRGISRTTSMSRSNIFRRAEAPSPEEFGAARQREGEALGNILKTHGFGHPNLGRWLSRIPNETLIVWGEKDRIVPSGQAKIWASLIPKAKVLMVPGVGHLNMQEAPAPVTAIGDFLERA